MLRIGTKRAEFIIVCASYSRGLDERRFAVLYGVFSASNSDYWEFVNPASFVGYFLKSSNGEVRAEELISTLSELKRLMPDYANLGLGRATGDLVGRFTWRGKLRAAPQGLTLDEAMKQAAENSMDDTVSRKSS